MPLLRKKLFAKASEPEFLKDNELVFYCEETKEIFRNYEDYFQRIMLLSSMVWSCSLTGRPSLTYDEAIESEKAAKKILKTFPQLMKAPVIMVAAQTKRSALSELLDDVFNYVKDHFFKNEELDALNVDGKTYRSATILEVILPEKKNSPIKAANVKYRVKADGDEKEPREWVIKGDSIRRDRSSFTKDKCKLFLKQHIEQVNGMLKIKNTSFKKFVTDEGIKFDDIFFGKPPDFELSKKLILMQQAEEKKKATTSKTKKSSKTSNAKDGKQQSISKYLNKSTDVPTAQEKKVKAANEKNLRDEMERIRKENDIKEAELLKKKAEEKAELTKQASLVIKKYATISEDQDLQDQRVIPAGKPVNTLVGMQYFSDFIYVLEFMTSFAELLSIKDKFNAGVTMEILERALILKEVNGPLSDIFQVLLSTIFTLQIEEENEVVIRYDSAQEFANKKGGVPHLRKAADAALWVEHHYNARLNELPMDSTTISELLRLHFLSSGALIEDHGSRWRFQQRGGYQSSDDPGVLLTMNYPHILRALKSYTVFSLPTSDILKMLRCLIDQLMTYSSVRDLIEERMDAARTAKFQFISANASRKRREQKANSEKYAMREENRKKIAAFVGTSEEKQNLKKELDEKQEKEYARIDSETERDIKVIQKEIDKCKEKFFDYQIFLGSDRAFRSYWLFESLPGLFVEHNPSFAGKCLDKQRKHIPGLAQVPENERKKFITQIVMNSKLSNDKENQGEIFENLLINYKSIENGLNDTNKTNGKVSTGSPKRELIFTHTELLMCTANAKTCPVHIENYSDRVSWSYYNTEEEITALIESLNTRGLREKVLRENLETEKELIVKHISMCPTAKISFDTNDRESVLSNIVHKTFRKYEQADLNHKAGTEPNVIFEAALRENILECELKLTVGYLGTMKVTNRDEWRSMIENFGYESHTVGSLKWGQKRISEENNEESHVMEENGISDEDLLSNEYDPGYDLPDTQIMESEGSLDESMINVPLHDSQTLKNSVRAMASAVLQIEQSVDARYLRHPFAPKKISKEKVTMLKQLKKAQTNLASWEESLMRSTNFSQVFLHYNVLYDAILWSRSIEKIACMLCRRKGDPNMTLLCDECNKACHMYCLKPKLKQIPEGDWFCPKCKPENYKEKRGRKRKIFVEEKVEEEEEAEFGHDVLEEMVNEFDKCVECEESGAAAHCYKCKASYHVECTNNLTSTPQKRWLCDVCKETKTEVKKAKKVLVLESEHDEDEAVDDIGDIEEEEEEEEEDEDNYFRKNKKRNKKDKSLKVSSPLIDNGSDIADSDEADDEEYTTVQASKKHKKKNKQKEKSEREKKPAFKINGKLKPGRKRKLVVQVEDDDDEYISSPKVKKVRKARKSTVIEDEDSGSENDMSLLSRKALQKAKKSLSDEDLSTSRRSRRTGDDLPLHSVNLYTLLEDVIKHQDSWPFNRPVSIKEVPDYYTIIKHPMDFAKVKSKLNMGKYTNNFDVMEDIQLVFANCDLYNTSETDIYNAGIRLEQYVEKRCNELCLPFKPSDMQTTDNEDEEKAKKKSTKSTN